MPQNFSYNNIIQLFANMAAAHLQINSFDSGQRSEAVSSGGDSPLYPRLYAVPIKSLVRENTVEHTFQVSVLDMVAKDESNRDEVLSDTHQMLQDIVKVLRHDIFLAQNGLMLTSEPVFLPTFDQHYDSVYGWGGDIVIHVPIGSDCGLPIGTFGSTGFNGSASSNTGASGFSGFSGATGSTGASGFSGASGSSGYSGSPGSLQWTYNDHTSFDDPGAGFISMNDTDLSLVSKVLFSKTTAQGQSMQYETIFNLLVTELGADVLFYSVADPSNYISFEITDIDDDPTFVSSLGFVLNESSGSFVNGELVGVIVTAHGAQGASGASGFSGASGRSGFSGIDGQSGTSGRSGFSGVSVSGISGRSGFSGVDGQSGASGRSGFSGIDGQSGTSGRSGFSGVSGFSGATGATGSSGFSGFSNFIEMQRFVPTTGTTVNIAASTAKWMSIIIEPAGTLANLTISIPQLLDGQIISFTFVTALTALTLSTTASMTLVNAIGATPANSNIHYVYNLSQNKGYRF